MVVYYNVASHQHIAYNYRRKCIISYRITPTWNEPAANDGADIADPRLRHAAALVVSRARGAGLTMLGQLRQCVIRHAQRRHRVQQVRLRRDGGHHIQELR